MSRTTVLSPAALTIGQKVSLLTSVTCPTVTVGPVVSKLDLTLTLPLLLKLKLLLVLKLTLAMFMLPKQEPSEDLKEDALSKEAGDETHLQLGEIQRFRAIIGACFGGVFQSLQCQNGENSTEMIWWWKWCGGE